MIEPAEVPVSRVRWQNARRIIRSSFPPIDLFEDIAPPEDWPVLIAAEEKTNPRLIASLGAIDLVPPARRVSGPGASFLMAPFTHVSTDRPSRFSDGTYGVLYAAKRFDTALLETMYHHSRFMAQTREAPGWTSQFRELTLTVKATLHDLRGGDARWAPALDRENYAGGECVGLFFPDTAGHVVQGRHLDYHWDGQRVDLYRDAGSGEVYRVR